MSIEKEGVSFAKCGICESEILICTNVAREVDSVDNNAYVVCSVCNAGAQIMRYPVITDERLSEGVQVPKRRVEEREV